MPRAVENFETKPPLGVSVLHLANHACITMNMSDRLRLIRFPPDIVDHIRMVLQRRWIRGIQNERSYANAHEFKLCGNPWDGYGIEAIGSRIAIMAVLTSLYHRGWFLVMAVDISKKMLDKDSLIFREGPLPVPADFLSISFNHGDRLRIMGEEIPPNVLSSVRALLGQTIQEEEWRIDGIAYEFKLYGRPWYARGEIAVKTRVLLLNILDGLVLWGYEVYASIDLSTGRGEHGRDTDSWFLKKPKVKLNQG